VETPPSRPAGEVCAGSTSGQLEIVLVQARRASGPRGGHGRLVGGLQALGAQSVRSLDGITESVVFSLPRELARR